MTRIDDAAALLRQQLHDGVEAGSPQAASDLAASLNLLAGRAAAVARGGAGALAAAARLPGLYSDDPAEDPAALLALARGELAAAAAALTTAAERAAAAHQLLARLGHGDPAVR